MRIFAENSVPVAYKAIIAGASGLIGGELLNIILQHADYEHVLILVRAELPLKHKKLTQLVIDFDKLKDHENDIRAHAIFSCLGSTRKKTPDMDVYRKIDHDYPLQLAQMAAKNGVEQFHLVSSLGADASTSNFYTKMKGEIERDIKETALKCLHIYRPAFLTGDRKEERPLEGALNVFMKIIDPLLVGGLKKYRSIPAKTVAMAMYKESIINERGIFIHPSDKIKQLA
jgi:uncharacterized protein YbjT (DUF2867 family)